MEKDMFTLKKAKRIKDIEMINHSNGAVELRVVLDSTSKMVLEVRPKDDRNKL